jgi:hypothetical protein
MTRRVVSIPLPRGTDAVTLAFLRDGRLVVGLGDYLSHRTDTLLITDPEGSRPAATVHVPDASSIKVANDGTMIVGSQLPTLVRPDGSQTAVTLPGGTFLDPRAGGVVLLRAGRYVAVAGNQLIVGDEHSGHVSASLKLPSRPRPCGPPTLPQGGAPPIGQVNVCGNATVALAADATGTVWLVQQAGSGTPITVNKVLFA